MKKVLIYFTQFNRILGSSDYLPLMLISELQKEHDVTVALDWKSDFARASQESGIPIDLSCLRIEYIKPRSSFWGELDAIIPFYRTWQLKRLARTADVCISTVNMFDFGKPAHHFIDILSHLGDNAFNDFLAHAPEKRGLAKFKRQFRTWLGEKILRPVLGLRSTRKILADPREHIYPNSNYVEKVMKDFYGPFTSSVFYPPTIFEMTGEQPQRNPLRVAYVGRLSAERHIVEIIGIVERARTLTGLDLEIHIAGYFDSTPYVDKLRQIEAEKSWVQLVGALYGNEKETFLASASFAIQAEQGKAFDIAVVEYLKAGLVPLVIEQGGTAEVVANPALTYGNYDEATQILVRLLQDETFLNEQRRLCHERSKVFSMEKYMEKQRQLLAGILAADETV